VSGENPAKRALFFPKSGEDAVGSFVRDEEEAVGSFMLIPGLGLQNRSNAGGVFLGHREKAAAARLGKFRCGCSSDFVIFGTEQSRRIW
jgi:hypothetical protein